MRYRFSTAVLLAVASGAPLCAHATLGGAPTASGSGQPSVKAARAAVQKATTAYNVNELTLASGTIVREYVASDVVFAVSWRGPFMPDLRSLFGTANFDRYTSGVVAARKSAGMVRRGPVAVGDTQLVVVSGGHMRAFAGYAYLPALLPAGVSLSEIQ
jgi:hypothetical protein